METEESANVVPPGGNGRGAADSVVPRTRGCCRGVGLLLSLFRLHVPSGKVKPALAITLSVVGALLIPVPVFVAAVLADQAMETPGGGLLKWAESYSLDSLVMVLVALALLIPVIGFFEKFLFARLGEQAALELAKRVFSHSMSLPVEYHRSAEPTGLRHSLWKDVEAVRASWTFDLRVALKMILLLLALIALMLVVATIPALFAMGTAAVVALSVWAVVRFSAQQRENRPAADGAATPAQMFSEMSGGIFTVKAFAGENQQRSNFRHVGDQALAESFEKSIRHIALKSTVSLLLLAVLGYLFWFAANTIVAGTFQAGLYLAFVLLLAVATLVVVRLIKVFSALRSAIAAAGKIEALLAMSVEPLTSGKYLPASRERLRGKVEARKLSFRYPESDAPTVLREIHFSLKPGERMALVGPPASGKSTLLQLIPAIYPVISGCLQIDERPAGEYPLGWLRSQIGWVPASIDVFRGTVAANIACGRPEIGQPEILKAAKKAGADGLIEALPEGFQTQLPARLSAELVRRIALARVFLEDPPVVVIDAPLRPVLDPEAASGVAGAEDRLMNGRTAISVTERQSVAEGAKEILVMSAGKVIDRGTHQELVNRPGYYQLLCQSRFGDS